MAITTTQVTNLADSIAQAVSDFNTCFITDTGSSSPSSTTIINGVSGTGTTNTLGRILNYLDLSSELNLLAAGNTMASNVTAYIGGLQALSGFYPQFYPVFDKLDSTVGGLNAYLATNSLQVNAFFANAFNYWAANAVAVTPGRTSSNAPVAITAGNFFPYAAVDSLWNITCSGATTFSVDVVGTNASTAVAGGGVGQIYIYKVNASNAIGSATFTVSYTNAAGTTSTATFSTTSGSPTASGSLSAGFSVSGAIGSAITGVTGTGMTSAEQYRFGIKLVRAAGY